MRSSSSSRPGCGVRGSASPDRRSTSRTDRSSPNASLLACLIAVSAVRACSGCSSMRWSATPACTLMSEMLCASTSCSSRAMRSRSSLARRRASSSPRSGRLGGACSTGASGFSDAHEDQQPRQEGKRSGEARPRLVADEIGQERECRPSDDHHDDGDGSVAGDDRRDERHDERQEDRPPRVVARPVREGDAEDHQEDGDGKTPPDEERRRARREEGVGERIQRRVVGLVPRREVCAHELDRSGHEGDHGIGAPSAQPFGPPVGDAPGRCGRRHTGTVSPRAGGVIARRAAAVLRRRE